jgi:hypothetical protein
MTIDQNTGPTDPPAIAPGTSATGSSPAAVQRRDAIIFVPGLSSMRHRNLAHIADVLCNELDRAATTEAARFAVRQTTARSGDDAEVVRSIWRIDGDDSVPVVDIYGVDHSTIEQADAMPTNPVARVLTLALSVLAGVVIWAAAWIGRNRRAKSLAQMLQLLLCLAILLLLGAYLITAVFALVQLVTTAVAGSTGTAAPRITLPQVVVVVGAVLGTLLPGVREHLATAAEQYLRMMRYLWVAGPRNNLRGELLTLLERASEREDVDRIHLVGFSFGSLVAIDMVLPASKAPTTRMGRVKSLTTIGCPFDLVRMLHPSYFEDRFTATGADPPWTNIYDPIDVLGSNFRNDNRQGEATVGVKVHGADRMVLPAASIAWNPGQRLGFVSGLMLASLRVHAQYWGANPRAESALGYVVTRLFGGTPVLR